MGLYAYRDKEVWYLVRFRAPLREQRGRRESGWAGGTEVRRDTGAPELLRGVAPDSLGWHAANKVERLRQQQRQQRRPALEWRHLSVTMTAALHLEA
jgi:hypothetical protein